MGFWKALLGGNEDDRRIEREIQEHIAESLVAIGAPVTEAAPLARACIEAAKEESRKQGTQRLPPNYGDLLLQQEKMNTSVAQELQKKRQERVSDDDIRWYWNMRELERRAMEQMYRAILYATWKSARTEGRSDEEAAVHARKFHAYWGDPDDTRVTLGDDRPLPIELMKRENTWFEREKGMNPRALELRLANSSSYNAVIRAEIRAGRL